MAGYNFKWKVAVIEVFKWETAERTFLVRIVMEQKNPKVDANWWRLYLSGGRRLNFPVVHFCHRQEVEDDPWRIRGGKTRQVPDTRKKPFLPLNSGHRRGTRRRGGRGRWRWICSKFNLNLYFFSAKMKLVKKTAAGNRQCCQNTNHECFYYWKFKGYEIYK